MMSNKSAINKIKWLTAGVISGVFITAMISQFVSPKLLTEEEKDLLQIRLFQKHMEYSQWPSFLTDASFDIV